MNGGSLEGVKSFCSCRSSPVLPPVQLLRFLLRGTRGSTEPQNRALSKITSNLSCCPPHILPNIDGKAILVDCAAAFNSCCCGVAKATIGALGAAPFASRSKASRIAAGSQIRERLPPHGRALVFYGRLTLPNDRHLDPRRKLSPPSHATLYSRH